MTTEREVIIEALRLAEILVDERRWNNRLTPDQAASLLADKDKFRSVREKLEQPTLWDFALEAAGKGPNLKDLEIT